MAIDVVLRNNGFLFLQNWKMLRTKNFGWKYLVLPAYDQAFLSKLLRSEHLQILQQLHMLKVMDFYLMAMYGENDNCTKCLIYTGL